MYINTCTMCNQQYTTERKKRKYCSQECYIKFREINGSPRTSLLKGSCIDCSTPISITRKRCGDCSKKFFNTERKRYKMTTNLFCKDCGIEKTPENTFSPETGIWATQCRLCLRKIKNKSAQKIKQECVNYKGGKCQKCGYKKCLGALHFHHLDPSRKDFTIARYKSSILNEKIKSELDKCILLCSNCHAEEHEKQKYQDYIKAFKSNKPYVEIC